jgi:subtilisin family serine protease
MTSRPTGRLGRLLAALTVAALTAATVPTAYADPERDRNDGVLTSTEPTSYGAPGAEGAGRYRPRLDHPVTVTLVTGDRVVLTPTDRGEPRVGFRPRPGGTGGFSVHRSDDGVYVTPHDVAGLVPRVLDPELFNVTAQVDMGFDDASSMSLPLIVEHAGESALRRTGAAPIAVTGELGSISAASARLPKRRAAELGAELAPLGSMGRRAVAGRLGGATRIWLDRVVTAASAGTADAAAAPAKSLDGYLTQVGAPSAWDRGLTGAGVTVAVLDTGVDGGHPALAGQVETVANFTESATDGDLVGHGTHVASLLAGTGAGSDGARQGIAPGATLLSGKVLGDEGRGQLSWVIAGMEWAAARGADVVNLSLGGRAVAASDPVMESLERLSADGETLFVVAAGNHGWRGDNPFSIDTPGIAPSALTVAAVGPDDVQATISSEGPTLGSYGLKPDVSAPGIEILGAKAGAREGDPDLYHPLSGTSMSTPLVAGAAALLTEQHPDWAAARVKAAVTGSADPADPTDPWHTGSGRLDLAAATDTVHGGTASLDVGYLEHPNDSMQTRPLQVENEGDLPVTLDASDTLVDIAGNDAPANAVTVEPATVTVEPHAQAVVDVTVDPAALPDNAWRGVVSLSDGSEERVRVPIGLYDEPEAYALRISVLDRNGDPWNPSNGAEHPNWDPTLQLFDRVSGRFHRLAPGAGGEATIRIQPGRYSLFGRVVTPGETPEESTMTVVGTTDLTVDEDTHLVLDARKGRPLTPPAVDGRDVGVAGAALVYSSRTGGKLWTGYSEGINLRPQDVEERRVFYTPVARVRTGVFEAIARWRLEPRPGLDDPGRHAEALDLLAASPDLSPTLSPRLDRRDQRDLALVDHTVHPVATSGAQELHSTAWTTVSEIETNYWQQVRPPHVERVLTNVDPDQRRAQCLYVEVNYWAGLCGAAPTLRPGREIQLEIGGDLYAARANAFRTPDYLLFAGGLSDGHHAGAIALVPPPGEVRLLTASGDELGRVTGNFAILPLPNKRMTLRLVYDQDMTGTPLRVARDSHTVWDFTSSPPADPSQQLATEPPLLVVDPAPRLTPEGTAPRRGSLELQPSFDSATGLDRVTDVRLWWSVDDGRHWKPSSVRREGDTRFAVRITGNDWRRGPAVSLRVTARDQDGNRVDQTVIGLIPTP